MITAPTAGERADALRRLAAPDLDLGDADALARFVLPHLNTATRWAKLAQVRLLADRHRRLTLGLADPDLFSRRYPAETESAHLRRECATTLLVLDALLDTAVRADTNAARADAVGRAVDRVHALSDAARLPAQRRGSAAS